MNGGEERSALALDALSATALAYLAVPLLIFLATWLRPLAALSFFGLIGVAVYSISNRFQARWRYRPTTIAIVMVCFSALAWSALSGGSHYVYANPDWTVRDSVLGDLTYSEWPPSYRFHEDVHYILRSAIGFFLPVAAVAKLIGAELIPPLLYFWTALGVAVFFLLLPLPVTRSHRVLASLLIVIAFSGMDVLGVLLMHGHYPIFPLRLEWWNDFEFRTAFSYSSLTGQLIWAPNHALPMWIATALVYRHWRHKDVSVLLCLLLPLLPLTSPLALPGLAPFAFFALIYHFSKNGRLPSVPIVMLIVTGIVATFLIRLQTLDVGAISVTSNATSGNTTAIDYLGYFRNYLVFVLLEFAILGLALFPLLTHSRGLFLLVFSVLLLLPLVTLGPSNDLLLRVSTPSLLVLAILTMQTLTNPIGRWNARHRFVVLVLLIGAHTPLNEAARAILWNAWKPDYTRSLVEIQRGFLPPHYVGRLTDPILIFLLRAPSMVPSRDARQ
jgi:hypothetical protein